MKYIVITMLSFEVLFGRAFGSSCLDDAASLARVDKEVILAISMVESALDPLAVNRSNNNGSEDVCLMQINSIHFPRLKSLGVGRQELLDNPCVCLLVGGAILGEMIESTGNVWDGVAAYNAGPKRIEFGRNYEKRVFEEYKELVE